LLIFKPLTYGEKKVAMTARSHFLRRVRHLKPSSPEELTRLAKEALERGTVQVKRYAPGSHAGYVPMAIRDAG
jgi:hypothetical protein